MLAEQIRNQANQSAWIFAFSIAFFSARIWQFAMKPNDENGHLPASQRPFRILIISGSDRRQYNCPGVDSKSRTLMLRMAERLPQEWEIDSVRSFTLSWLTARRGM